MPEADNTRLLTKLGDTEVWQVVETMIPTSVRWLLPDAPREQVDGARAWLQPRFMDENGYLLQSIHSYLLKTAEHNILIDTGVGNHKRRGGGIPAFNMLETPFLERLRVTGVSAEDVDYVLCTHIHGDHTGWNAKLEGEDWVPTFTRARHLFAEPEYEHFTGIIRDQPASRQLWEDSIEPVAKAGLVDVVEPDHRVCPEVCLEPSFGHTPGHVSVRLDAGGRAAVFIGDAMHSPIQAQFPRLKCALGGPEAPSREGRLALLERYADTGTLVFGAHFAWPCGGTVHRDGDAFRFEALDPQNPATVR